jgi:hypothetical protein
VNPDPLREVRFFVDENLAGLGLALRRVRPLPDVVVASHPPIADLVPRDDPDWIPDVAGRRWVVITNDRHIRTRPTEAPKAVEHGLVVAHLDAGTPARVWDYLRLLLRHWDDVEALYGQAGPSWLELNMHRVRAFRRDYEPGKPPRLEADPREERLRQARARRRKRPSGAARRQRRSDAAAAQDELPLRLDQAGPGGDSSTRPDVQL